MKSACASEQQKRGKELYAHYCMHCHGEKGRQNEGFNWSSMPDPKPKDLSNKSEMSTFKDEDIFNTVSRDMKDTSPGGDKIGRMGVHVRDPLKRRWQRSVYLGEGSTNPEAVRRAQP